MSGILSFLEGKKKILSLNDLKYFFKDSFLSTQKDVLTRVTPSNDLSLSSDNLYKYVIDPIYDLDGEMVENGYVLKSADSYNYYHKDFMFIVDDIKKIIILNEFSFLNMIYPSLEPTQEERTLMGNCMYTNYDDLSDEEVEEFKKFNEYFIKENIGSYKVLSVSVLKHEFNNNLYKFIEANLEDFAKKTDMEKHYKEEIIIKSKDLFTGISIFEIEILLGRHKPNYLQIINAYQGRLNDNVSYIYNYALEESLMLDKYKEFIHDIMFNECDDRLLPSLNLRNMYIFKSSKEYLDENIGMYQNDESLIRMQDILLSVDKLMKTITVNGEKVKNEIKFDYSREMIIMPDNTSKHKKHGYIVNGDIEIKYGNKVLYKVDRIGD